MITKAIDDLKRSTARKIGDRLRSAPGSGSADCLCRGRLHCSEDPGLMASLPGPG